MGCYVFYEVDYLLCDFRCGLNSNTRKSTFPLAKCPAIKCAWTAQPVQLTIRIKVKKLNFGGLRVVSSNKYVTPIVRIQSTLHRLIKQSYIKTVGINVL